MDAVVAGELLWRRHGMRSDSPVDETRFLGNYAEMARAGDWTLRSALVRLAQPDPVRVGALLHLTRRLDRALAPLLRSAQRHLADTDRELTPGTLGRPAGAPVVDARASDLARLVAAGLAPEVLMDAYRPQTPAGPAPTGPVLTDDERVAVPLLALVVELDRLAVELTDWAHSGPRRAAPVDSLDRAIRGLGMALDRLGVPQESEPRSPGRSRRG